MITEKGLYKMLAEIHNAVSDMACGCMGANYTSKRVEQDDKNTKKYITKNMPPNSTYMFKYIKSDKPLDYIGNIIRQYVEVEEV